jgi:hypothetical protein
VALADAAALNALLSQERRPTIREVKAALGTDTVNPFSLASKYDESLRRDLPVLIARIEGLCPGARFFSLGRDSVQIADFLEAFYDSLGQGDRVGRIPMSGSSFSGVGNAELQSVLQGAGMVFSELGTRPQIIFDRTSLGSGSQSTRVLKAAFAQANSQGLSANELAGMLLVLYTFMADALRALPAGAEELSRLKPTSFNWPLYLVGLGAMAFAVWRAARRSSG